uniref:Uncharacterized protein n=1 Tax=Zea mays TaxID=4577 RepID=C0PLM9_MAIZE|nr:unknown [Zea mays]
MNKGLPAVERAVHAEEFEWMLALWAERVLLVGCPPQNTGHTVGVVATLDEGRLLERYPVEADGAHPAIRRHPVAAACSHRAHRHLADGDAGAGGDRNLGGGRGGRGGGGGGHGGGDRGGRRADEGSVGVGEGGADVRAGRGAFANERARPEKKVCV